jgi:hypothetical protein
MPTPYDPDRKPVDADARRVMWTLRLGKLEGFTEADCQKWRWKGAISRCSTCGDRGYVHGWCFGCGRSFQ